MEPNYSAALEFLRWWSGPPWVLTAIAVDKKGIFTATLSDDAEVFRWLQKYGEHHNIYFSVNPCVGPVSKKPERADVASLAWLHVDLDPRAGEDLKAERDRIVAQLTVNLPEGVPEPSAVNFSGGGYQGFWRLEEPLPINGVLERAEEAKLYNLRLETIFGADSCHNVDRIMRLPGTLNRPDEKKRAKGRSTELAEVVVLRDHRYPLSAFQKAPPVQMSGGSFAQDDVEVSGNIKRFADVHEIPKVSDKCRVLIVQGMDPDDPTKYPSRSEPLFAVVCEMVRCELSNDEIYAVITDPGFRISESVLEKKSGADRYAKHQIKRAREKAIAPELLELNERHAVISNVGGKCLVATEKYNPIMGRDEISFQTFQAIRDRYSNRKVWVPGPKDVPVPVALGKWWLEHEKRRQFDSIVFAPGRESPGDYNLWRGFACEARAGDCQPFLDHLLENLCQGIEPHFRYLVGWMARAVQSPWKNGQVAVVLRGKQGTGKGFFTKAFGSLWGRHYLHIKDSKHLLGSFNGHFEDCVILFSDEAIWAGDKKHEGILKGLITEDTITVERKGVDVYSANNHIHLIMASNEDWVVPAGLDDRRFFALDVADNRQKDVDYFRRLQEQLDGGGREALLHYLLTYDLSEYEVRDVPQTKLLHEQKLRSMSGEEAWWLGILRDGILDARRDEEWTGEALAKSLLYDYALRTKTYRPNECTLYHFLRRVCPDDFPRRKQRNNSVEVMDLDGKPMTIKRPYYWVFPSLEECRAYWDENKERHSWDVEYEDGPEDPEVPF